MEIQNPNDFTANESAEVRTVSDDAKYGDDTGGDYTGFLPAEEKTEEPETAQEFTPFHWEEDPLETLLRQIQGEVSAARIAAEATAANTATLLALFGEVVTVVNALAEKADGLFGGDSGPKIGGPAGMILSALLPKR